MLTSTKSEYFIKLLFSYVDEKQKLNIVKFNKSLQNIINITIANYKYFTGRYIIYESKGIGKEYIGTNNKLVYEGEFFHGERKGKGKEYWAFLDDGNVKYEGEFLHGQWNGKGREYYFNNILVYEGEFLNGKRHGKGIRYNGKDKIEFEGKFVNGKEWEGKSHIFLANNYISSGGLFQDTYIDDKNRVIKKEYFWTGKLLFEGEYRDDLKWNGKGYDPDGKVAYELINGNGKVKEYNKNTFQLIFDGEYLNGKKHGNGKEYDEKGKLVYEGEYFKGKRQGKGKKYDSYYGTLVYEGGYLNDKRHGKEKEYFYDNGELKFEGEYLYDFKFKGKLYKNGKLEYEGEFLYNKQWNGKG